MARIKQKAAEQRKRPMPPVTMQEGGDAFMPAPELSVWVKDNIFSQDGPLYNEEHAHLEFADIAFLWAAYECNKQGRRVLGQCEEVAFRCGAWQKGRQEQQMIGWFGHVPSYLITIDSMYALNCSDAEFCALIEHELYHIGHMKDEFGQPAFTRDGLPKIGMRGHDVEEFTGVVRRYGASEDVAKMVKAAQSTPEVAKLNIATACGTCLLRVA